MMNKMIIAVLSCTGPSLFASSVLDKFSCIPVIPCITVGKEVSRSKLRSRKTKNPEIIPVWEDKSFIDEIFQYFSDDNDKFNSKRKRTPITLWDDEAFIEEMLKNMEADQSLYHLQSPGSKITNLTKKFSSCINTFSRNTLSDKATESELIRHANALLSIMRGFIFASDELIQDLYWSHSKKERVHTNSWIDDIKIFSSATGSVDSFRLVYQRLTDEDSTENLNSYVEKRIRFKLLNNPEISDIGLYQQIEKTVYLYFIEHFQSIFSEIYHDLTKNTEYPVKDSFFYHTKNWKTFKEKIYFPNLHRSSIQFIDPWLREINETETKIVKLKSIGMKH